MGNFRRESSWLIRLSTAREALLARCPRDSSSEYFGVFLGIHVHRQALTEAARAILPAGRTAPSPERPLRPRLSKWSSNGSWYGLAHLAHILAHIQIRQM